MSKLDELDRRLAALRGKTEAGFADRARALTEAAQRLDSGDLAAADEIKRLAHRLRGIAGSAGHPALTERAARLETAITSGASGLAAAEGARRLAKAALEAISSGGTTQKRASVNTATKTRGLGLRVVALDDEGATRRLLELTLVTAGGCDAVVAERPEDAMRSILENDAQLVIVDAMMPEMSGMEFYEAVRQRCGPQLPVVILSAASINELGWQLPDDPRLRWMRKPFRPGHLVADLREFMNVIAEG